MIIGPARRLKYKKRIRRKNHKRRRRKAKEDNIELNDTVSKSSVLIIILNLKINS